MSLILRQAGTTYFFPRRRYDASGLSIDTSSHLIFRLMFRASFLVAAGRVCAHTGTSGPSIGCSRRMATSLPNGVDPSNWSPPPNGEFAAEWWPRDLLQGRVLLPRDHGKVVTYFDFRTFRTRSYIYARMPRRGDIALHFGLLFCVFWCVSGLHDAIWCISGLQV